MKILLAALAALAVLAGCNDPEPSAGPTKDVGTVELHRVGGLEGLDQSVRVDEDGRVELRDIGEDDFTRTGDALSDEDLEQLHRLVGSEEFAELEDRYAPEDECCDRFEYTVTADVAGEDVSSATLDGVDAPNILDEAIAILLPYIP